MLYYNDLVMAVLYVVEESQYVWRLYFILFSKSNLRGY